MTLLQARRVSKRYGPTQAIQDVDLGLTAGEVVAVTGPSGSGKSTLLLCLSGIVRPDEGEVWFAGIRLDDRPESARSRLRRTEIGVLLQHGQLVPELPAVENVAFPLLLNGSKGTQAKKSAMEWLERFGVAGEAAKRPGELSGGQQQRVALARAMVTHPRLLFADEPTGSGPASPSSPHPLPPLVSWPPRNEVSQQYGTTSATRNSTRWCCGC